MKHALWIILLLLLPVAELTAQQTATVSLGGHQHVPPVQSPGSGTINVITEGDSLYLDGDFQDLRGAYRSASIHYGSSRETGNRLLGLKVEVGEDRRSGTLNMEDNRFELRPSIMEALSEGHLYVNITSDRNQSGEIRGQIPGLTDGPWRGYIWENNN